MKQKEVRDIAIYGAGGFGKEVACLINLINKDIPTWNLIGFFDDNPQLKGQMISHYAPCIGCIEELNHYSGHISVVFAIGNSHVVKTIVGNIWNEGVDYPNLIHPDFYVTDPDTFHIGRGNIISDRCSASCDVTIGDFNLFNGSICIGHDNSIGSFNTFMPGVRISGEVEIGNGNFLGLGSMILQQIKIGNNVRLGAGAVLMTKPKDDNTYIGNPAKMFKY